MDKLSLADSRWATPEARRYQASARAARTPSPNKSIWAAGANHKTTTPSTTIPQIRPFSASPAKETTRLQPLSSAQRQYETRLVDLQRFRRLFRRLTWKANSLTHWSHRALNIAQEHRKARDHPNNVPHAHPDRSHTGPTTSLGHYEMEIDPIEAERQFKIDFYEFYALFERALVCLLGVWGIIIDSSANFNDIEEKDHKTMATTNGTGESLIGNSRVFHGSSHRFHANVLAALDQPSNPLHAMLGVGDAREYIGVAKEFRNKWKDVEVRPDDSFQGEQRFEEEWDVKKVKRYENVLRDLRLDELLGSVLEGLEEAGRKAEAEMERLGNLLGDDVDSKKGLHAAHFDSPMADIPFEVGLEKVDDDYEMTL